MIGSSRVTISAVTSETSGSSLRAVGRRGRQLGADDEQLALQPDEQLVQLRVRFGLGAGQPSALTASSTAPYASGPASSLPTRPP